jgi:hypothetical protein
MAHDLTTHAAPWLKCWPHGSMQQAIIKNVQKIYLHIERSHHSMNSEPRSYLLPAAYMSQVESLWLLRRDPPRMGKACVSLWSFGSFKVQSLLPESCVNICSACDITSWLVGAWSTGWLLLHTVPPSWLYHRLISHPTKPHWNPACRMICAPLLWVTSPRIHRLEKTVCGP